MIYELVDSSLGAIAAQWTTLSSAFQELAASLPAGDVRIPTTGNPNPPPAIPPAGSMQQRATDQGAVVEGSRPGIVLLRPATAMFASAIPALNATEAVANSVAVQFNVFGSTASPADSVEVSICRAGIDDLLAMIRRAQQDFEEVTSIEGQRYSLSHIGGSMADIAAYPMLTSDVASLPPTASPALGGRSSAPLQRVVDVALRDVLGRLPRPKDPNSFVVALRQSFDLIDVEGHVSFVWNPRTYAGETELAGGVTGAQFSLYSRALVARTNSLPVLDGLRPLLPDPDHELVDAARAIVRSEFTEVVNELGREGGPRIARVDDLFESLLTRPVMMPTGGVSAGHIRFLQSVMGLNPNQVNTLDEEQVVSSFLVLLDYVQSLEGSWVNFRDFFFGRDLGTRLVRLSRALSVTSESVGEVYLAMDSVYVGSAERQVASFPDDLGRPVLVEELLSWIVSFASEEAPVLVREGGRKGVGAIVPTAIRLRGLVDQFLDSIPYQPSLPDGLRHPRVAHPLREVRDYLLQVEELATQVMTP